jgi:hypothetical protein
MGISSDGRRQVMGLARFFDRSVTAIGNHFTVGKESLEGILADRPIDLLLDSQCSSDPNAQTTCLLLTNILSRLYPTLSLRGDDSACAAAAEVARKINPNIEIVSDEDGAFTHLAVGRQAACPAGVLSCSSSGWVASVSHDGSVPIAGPVNPYAAAFAAGVAAAYVFRKVFAEQLQDSEEAGSFTVSLLDFTRTGGSALSLPEVDLGQIAFVGLGAVANSALWTLGRHTDIGGKAWLVDHEELDLSNLQRYALALDEDEGACKAGIAARALEGTNIECVLAQKKLADFADEFGGTFPVPTVCVSVDNSEGRYVSQALLPRLAVNGYTGAGDLGASWHGRPEAGQACLACLYQGTKGKDLLSLVVDALGLTHKEALALWTPGKTLGDGELRKVEAYRGLSAGDLNAWRGKSLGEVYRDVACGGLGMPCGGSQDEVVPLAHQSVLAGVLMVSELVKRLTPELAGRSQTEQIVSIPNIVRALPPPGKWLSPARAKRGCICSDQDYLAVYRQKWGAC